VFSLAALTVVVVGVAAAPTVAVLTELRDRPLIAALAGIDGSVSSVGTSCSATGPAGRRPSCPGW
jgi:hypothetical protein